VTESLSGGRVVAEAGLPAEYSNIASFTLCGHFGDIAYHDGLIYAPVECNNDTQRHPAIYVYDEHLREVAHNFILGRPRNRLGWVAVNPLDGLLYSSPDDGHDYNRSSRVQLGRAARRVRALSVSHRP
jgi:hypothetical protein